MPPQTPAGSGIQTAVFPFDESPDRSAPPADVEIANDHQHIVDKSTPPANVEIGNDHQQIIDEEVAAALARSDAPRGRPWDRCNRSRLISCCAVTAIVIGAVVAIGVIFGGPDGPTSLFIPTDPPGATEANAWGIASRDGLTLRVVNALDDFWTPYFDQSLADWDAGDPSNTHPDVLTLIASRDTHDPDCKPTRGRLKVCNGDYGDTDWQGLNVILLSHDKIVHSIAKMNDYHIRNASPERQQYTMCHELGHGFGLAHTDENYYNIDRGDCMDYTVRPGNNLLPGTFNFGVLNELYGAPEPSTTQSPTTPGQRPSTSRPTNQNNDKEDKDKDKDKDDRRHLGEVIDWGPIPDSIMSSYDDAVNELQAQACYDVLEEGGGGRRLIQKCEKDLGNGYRVQVNQLPVFQEESNSFVHDGN